MDKFLFRKVHIKLTLLFSGITIAILIVMSICYLYISEINLYKNEFLSFKNSINTFLTNLEQQTVITHEWLISTEYNNGFLIELRDNGEEFLFNNRILNPEKKELFEAARQSATEQSVYDKSINQLEYSFPYNEHTYYAGYGAIKKGNAVLEYWVVLNIFRLERQITSQRLLFLGINIVASFAIFLFAFYFTKRLLSPIKESQKVQNQFIASSSHELRTPLAVILSCANASKKANIDDKNTFLSTIESEALRMSRLVNDMLLLAKTDNHTFNIETSLCEPDTLLLNSYEAFELLANEKHIKLEIHLPEDIVNPCKMDKERIAQVLAILIQNALNYTSGKGLITLSLTSTDKFIRYSIIDNGIGIPDDHKKEIFTRFYRVSQARSDEKHFGLGLSIAYEIIQAHKGNISVMDTPGGGSTFLIELPIHSQ